MKKRNKYVDGLDTNQFKIISEVSHYNSNYYVGLDTDLLYAKSDDDNTTEWWLVDNFEFHYLGYSFCSNNEILVRAESPLT